MASNLVDPADFGELPHIAPNHIEPETGRLLPHRTVSEDAVISAKHRFFPGQVLYSKIRPYLAKVVVAEFEGLCSADMYPIESELEPRFLRWWMLTREFTRRAAGEQARTVLPKINVRALSNLPIPVPPQIEQRRIAEILEDQLSRLDAGTRQVSSAERRLESWKHQSLDGLVREMASGRTTLGAVVRQVEAGRSFGGSAPPARAEEWGIIKVSAMTWGVFRPEENKAVRGDKIDPRYEIRAGDVLVSRANTTEYVGASVFVQETRARLLLSDKSLRIVPADGIEARWLATVLAARSTRRQVSRLATGTKDSMRNISQQALLSVTVPSATPAQQAQVVERAILIEQSASRLRLELATVEVRAKALRRAVLSAAFSGQLSERTYLDSTEELARV